MLLLMALPGMSSFISTPSQDELFRSVQGEAQIAHARELLVGHDSIRLTSASTRKVSQVNEFVLTYTLRSLKSASSQQAVEAAATIINESRRYGFDPLLLLAVIENESRFSSTIVGTHGEIGLMQIKPDTAAWIAQKANMKWSGPASLYNPSTNIRLGAAYLAMLRTKFGPKKDLYLSAYNMGVKSLNRALSSNSRPMIYSQKTIKHYSRIYLEFTAQGRKPVDTATRSYASI
jgi:soluble lytic murein transglycosylase